MTLLLSLLFSVVAPAAQAVPPDATFRKIPEREAVPRAPRPFPGGDQYEAEGEILWRARMGVRTALECTDPEGTGAVRALDSRPAGTIYVAAERGLYCVSPEVDALDRVQRIDGAPVGAPVGVAFESADRIWLATEEAFGAIDPRQGFGRTIGARDGAPAGPYGALRLAKDGSVLLLTDEGPYRYTPDAGAPPEVRVLAVEGAPYDPARVVELGVNGRLTLELEGSGTGGASLRYRRVGHHLWRALEAGESVVEDLEPGEHALELIALDRDLRRSEPALVRVRVPVPWYFRTRVLLVGAASALGILLALALISSRRAGGGAKRTRRALLSALLAFLIALQLLGGLVPHARSWPIIGFAMYTDVYREWGYAYQMSMYGEQRDGVRRHVRPWDSGYGQFEFSRDLADVTFGGPAAQRAWLARWNEVYGSNALRGFVIQDERYRLTPDGPVEVAPVVFDVFPPEALDGSR